MKEKTMERYAAKREKKLKPKAKTMDSMLSAPTAMPAHDARYDLDTLQRAEEIRRAPPRHRAAKQEGRKRMKELAGIVGGRKKKVVKES